MKVSEIKDGTGTVESVRVRPAGSGGTRSPAKGEEIEISWNEEAHAYLLRAREGVSRIEPLSRSDEDVLHDVCVRNRPRVAWVAEANDADLLIRMHTFPTGLRLDIEIGIDEQTVERARRLNPRTRTPQDLARWLDDQCLLPGLQSDDARTFLSAGAGPDTNDLDAFVLHGRSVRVHVKKVASPSDVGSCFVAARVARCRGRADRRPIVLVEGSIRFADATVAAWARGEGAAELRQLVADETSFLALWARYGEIEAKGFLDHARVVGGIAYHGWEPLPDGIFEFDVGGDPQAAEKLSRLDSDAQVDAARSVPAIIEDSALTWAEFEADPRHSRQDRDSFRGKVVGKLDPGHKTISLRSLFAGEHRPPTEGFLYISIQGYRHIVKRRQKAQERIRNLECRLPIAHLLTGARVPTPRRKELPALTPNVRGKVFPSHPPTPQQEEAIRVALNTPDVAVIQGPPGTGKTKIIEAIVERLNEELDTSGGAGAGQILVTGFQHVAVENALGRIDVNGVPAVQFGGPQGEDEFERSQSHIDRWVRKRAAQIRTRLPGGGRSEVHRWLTAEFHGYQLAPGLSSETVRLLRQVAGKLRGEVSSSTIDRIEDLADSFERSELGGTGDSEQVALERAIRALRVEPIGFEDDGPRNAQRLLTRLRRSNLPLDADECDLLGKAASWSDGEGQELLPALERLRRRLLLQVIPSVPPVAVSRDVIKVLSDARSELEQRFRTSRDAPDAAVAAYLNQLENNVHAVRRAVIQYSSVFGATCQQSASKDVADVKATLDYDTVLIDEAARSNPLDLFVPMAQARRRVILVGDHRQLPHIIDRQLQKAIEEAVAGEESIAAETQRFIERSLFEHVFQDFRKREAGDGTRRVVTLDVQFRMHPRLGEFVSREFYEAHEEPRLKAGLAPESFRHTLPGYGGAVAAWVDVPSGDGPEKPGRSKSRPAEAVALARELKRLLDAPEARELTFGCITFYSSQVKSIFSELVHHGITKESGERVHEISPSYWGPDLPDGRVAERLRIGTVDAFQGKEFDVVLLSVVRSNRLPDRTERDKRRRYGHLMSPNRLCVAMSRQKRLLIVFGDSALLDAPEAESAVGPLVRFRRELCGGEHGRLL